MERYTSAEVTKILAKSGKAKDVDFISSGRVIFLFTEEEEAFTHEEFEAAKASGLDMSGVEWFTKEETQEVCRVLLVYVNDVLTINGTPFRNTKYLSLR